MGDHGKDSTQREAAPGWKEEAQQRQQWRNSQLLLRWGEGLWVLPGPCWAISAELIVEGTDCQATLGSVGVMSKGD